MADARRLTTQSVALDTLPPGRVDRGWLSPQRRRQVWRLKGSLIGATIVLVVAAIAILAPVIAPANPYVGRTIDRLAPPFWIEDGTTQYLLGSDQLGRDSLSRLIFASR